MAENHTGLHPSIDPAERVRRRLREDLNLGPEDIDGIMTIFDEELSKATHLLDEWACDRCGQNKSTATHGVGGPSLCNDCIFGDD